MIKRLAGDWLRAPVPSRGHHPVATPGRTPRPPEPPAGPGAGTSYCTGTAPSGGPLPVEAQTLLRVMGEDLPAARDLVRNMAPLERGIYLFYIEQVAGLIYEANGQEDI